MPAQKFFSKRSLYTFIIFCAASFSIIGCGGSGGTNTAPVIKTGTFIDSPVAGLGYRATTLSGITDADGHYQYAPGETVEFFIGNISLGSTTATDVVTPLTLANTADMNNTQVINILRLLQSLDDDNDQTNTINITEQARSEASGVNLDITSPGFGVDPTLNAYLSRAGGNTTLIPAEQAVAHFETALGLPSSGAFAISGTITLPASVTEKKWVVIVDEDHISGNGWTASTTGTVTGSTLIYSVNKIPEGNYYIYTSVDMSENPADWPRPWKNGDFVGFGCLKDGEPCMVTIDSSKTVDIALRTFAPINIAGFWTWNEKQIEVINNPCAPIGQVDTYTIEIKQNGDQVTIANNAVTGSVNGNAVSANGTFLSQGISVQQTISLTVTPDGKNLTGTLNQASDTACTGTFEITATKNP